MRRMILYSWAREELSFFMMNTLGGGGLGQENEPGFAELQPVNFNDGKFIEEDPELVKHMNNCRDQLTDEENNSKMEVKKLSSEEHAALVTTNNSSNVEFTKLVRDLAGARVLFDDSMEQLFRQSNAIEQILEGKKAPVGFASLAPQKCFAKLGELVKEVSDKMQTNVKVMEKIILDLNQFKKTDEQFRDKLLKLLVDGTPKVVE